MENTKEIGKYWMTVKLGIYPEKADIRQVIWDRGKKIGGSVDQILENMLIVNRANRRLFEETELPLWEVSGTELGFSKHASLSTIQKRASKVGFVKPPLEAIVLAFIKCQDKKYRIGATEPLGIELLSLGSDGVSNWLSTEYCVPDRLFKPYCVWIFSK